MVELGECNGSDLISETRDVIADFRLRIADFVRMSNELSSALDLDRRVKLAFAETSPQSKNK